MLRNVRKGSLAAVERSAAGLGIVRSALEPDVESTDRPLAQLGQNRAHPLQCKSAKLSTIASAGGSKRLPRERQHQARHDRAADRRWRLVSSSYHHQPGLPIFHPQTNCKVQYERTRL